jgi:FkbM family methyltransferase
MGTSKISIVDIGANPVDGVPPYMHLVDKGLAHVWGFEPQKSAFDQLESSANKTYLPYAIGEGNEATLYVCQASGMTSLLEPDMEKIGKMRDFAHHAQILSTQRLHTTRLDNVMELYGVNVDFLRMDCQGSEFPILLHADRVLRECSVVELEVSFYTLYKNQQDFTSVCRYLNAKGFEFLRFNAMKYWETDKGRQLIEADAVFVKNNKDTKNLVDLLYNLV